MYNKDPQLRGETEEVAYDQHLLQEWLRCKEDIIYFAKKFNTHPAIIIGRFHHKEILPYNIGREFIIPIDLINETEE